MDKLVSIIIRTKNEERWIGSCLKSIFKQKYNNLEVVLVDNNSTDKTVERASKFPIKLVSIDQFKPGKAINKGVLNSNGEYIVCLSGHCIPVDDDWLGNLVKDLDTPGVAGVYGRQEPLSYTSDIDKRDLYITFGLDERIQVKDSFFHNANSAFTRNMWNIIPFDENVTNIEDRLWGEKVISNNYKIIYKPSASVYHWHGIHQDLDNNRAKNIVRILESMDTVNFDNHHVHPDDISAVAIIPLRNETIKYGKTSLLSHTIKNIRLSKYIDKIVVSTDCKETREEAIRLGADYVVLRPKELSDEHISVFDVLKYTVDHIEENDIHPEIVVMLEEIYPFRKKNTVDSVIEQLVYSGNDTIVAAVKEVRDAWQKDENNKFSLNKGALMPKALKEKKLFISAPGFCCATYSKFARDKSIFNCKVGLFEIDNVISSIAIRKGFDKKIANELFNAWSALNE